MPLETQMNLTEMQTLVEQLRAGSAMLYATLQRVVDIHQDGLIDGETEPVICVCCSELSGEVIVAPCPTMQVILENFSVSQSPTSADQSESDEPSDLHQTDEEASSPDPA
jgi:hypothetical protein